MKVGTVRGITSRLLGACVGLLAAATLAACTASAAGVSIRELATNSEPYEGRRVRTDGILRQFSPGTPDEHYVVEADGQYRVGLRGVAPDDVPAMLDQRVWVEGVFEFDPSFGIFIQATHVAVAD